MKEYNLVPLIKNLYLDEIFFVIFNIISSVTDCIDAATSI